LSKLKRAELLAMETEGLLKRAFENQTRAKDLKKKIELEEKELKNIEKSIADDLKKADDLGINEQDGFVLKVVEKKTIMSVIQKKE
jgi:hypothetical protein